MFPCGILLLVLLPQLFNKIKSGLCGVLFVVFSSEQARGEVEMEGVAHTFLAILLSMSVLFGDDAFG